VGKINAINLPPINLEIEKYQDEWRYQMENPSTHVYLGVALF